MKALIGHTGFIGKNLAKCQNFDLHYNSKNIRDIADLEYEEIICCGTPGIKWKANIDPEKDSASIALLKNCLQNVKAKKFTLISTIDVYDNPTGVDENSKKSYNHHPYGKHRSFFEDFIEQKFNSRLLRLPIVYGPEFKKNYLYDLLNKKNLNNICLDSEVQFYHVNDLLQDIDRAWALNSSLVNIATAPVKISKIVDIFFPELKVHCTGGNVFKTDMKTRYANSERYFYDEAFVIGRMRGFIENETINI